MSNHYKPSEFAEMIGVSVKTLQRWDREKHLIANRHPSGRRYYTHKQYVDYIGETQPDGTVKCPSCGHSFKLVGDLDC